MESLTPLDSLLLTIVLATLAIGLPVLLVFSIRFLWDRNLKLARSKDLEKLIWQLHRIASALEHQMNLSFPAVQPGTEEPRDLAYLQQPAVQAKTATQSAAAPSTAARAMQGPAETQPMAAEQASPQTPLPALSSSEPPGGGQRHGVNSMFDL
jgi:hypothetical protein